MKTVKLFWTLLAVLLLSIFTVAAAKDTTLEVAQVGSAQFLGPVKFEFTVKNIGTEAVATPLNFIASGTDAGVEIAYYGLELSTGEVKQIPYNKNKKSYGGAFDLIDQQAQITIYDSQGHSRTETPENRAVLVEREEQDYIEMPVMDKWTLVDAYYQDKKEAKERLEQTLGRRLSQLNDQNIEQYAEEYAQANLNQYKQEFQKFITSEMPTILLAPGEYVKAEKTLPQFRGLTAGGNQVKFSLSGVDPEETNKNNDYQLLTLLIDKREPLFIAGPARKVELTSAAPGHPALNQDEYWLYPYEEHLDREEKLCVTIKGRKICEYFGPIYTQEYFLDGKYYLFTVDGQKEEVSAWDKFIFKMISRGAYQWLQKNFPGFLAFEVNGVKITMTDLGTKLKVLPAATIPAVPESKGNPEFSLTYQGESVLENGLIEIPLNKPFGDQLVLVVTDLNNQALHVGIEEMAPLDAVFKLCDLSPGGTCWGQGHYLNTKGQASGTFDFYWNPKTAGTYQITLEAWEIEDQSVKSSFTFWIKVK